MKAKQIIATLVFTLLLLGLQAQDKYEYATIIYKVSLIKKYVITISQEGKYENIDGAVTEDIARYNISPAMEMINKMSKEGWDLYNSSVSFQPVSGVTDTWFYYLLRRKKN